MFNIVTADIKSIKFLISLIRHKKATPQKNAFEKSLFKKRNLLKKNIKKVYQNKQNNHKQKNMTKTMNADSKQVMNLFERVMMFFYGNNGITNTLIKKLKMSTYEKDKAFLALH